MLSFSRPFLRDLTIGCFSSLFPSIFPISLFCHVTVGNCFFFFKLSRVKPPASSLLPHFPIIFKYFIGRLIRLFLELIRKHLVLPFSIVRLLARKEKMTATWDTDSAEFWDQCQTGLTFQ